MRTSIRVRHRKHDYLNAVDLCLLDRLGKVIVARDEEEDIGGVVPRMRNEVQPDPQVHALLLPIDAKATEAQLHLGQLADPLLLRIRYPVLCGVVPVDTEQREARNLLSLVDQRLYQRPILDMDAVAE